MIDRMNRISLLAILLLLGLSACTASRQAATPRPQAPFFWENANVYFMLTDRFFNGNPKNDLQFGRTRPAANLRGFMGGDIKGITQKLEEGYFDQLGITAIWFTPVLEQIHDAVDEGTGATYGFHGYWTKDWTRLDPNFGTENELAELVKKAHQRGIRVILDVVVNHTGPVTAQDPVWDGWVRTEPNCTYKDYQSNIECTLVKNLPDVKTESNTPVEIPAFLAEKWKNEGRYKKEMAELDAFFQRTGYPRTPRYYLMKWLTDYVRQYGIDGYRCDTAKHVEESVWAELRKEADQAFADWKNAHPKQVLDNNGFYMVGEVYGYNISSGRDFNFGDKKVDFYNNGFNSLINFELKSDGVNSYENLFAKYSILLHGSLEGKSVLNYMSSHDDGSPYDARRMKPLETATKLLLCPGASQIYYGDETSRSLVVAGTQGDATLRSFMNWDELAANAERNGFKTQEVLAHWQKLGRFRRAHPAVGAGVHAMLSNKPYVFKRTFQSGNFHDVVVAGIDLPKGEKTIDTQDAFPEGAMLQDYYSGQQVKVENGKVRLNSEWGMVLLGK